MHRTTRRFWRCYESLPFSLQTVADQSFALLKRDPRHPSLHFKKTGKVWSARVGRHHRALAVPDGNGFLWIWIGTHDEYERIISGELSYAPSDWGGATAPPQQSAGVALLVPPALRAFGTAVLAQLAVSQE